MNKALKNIMGIRDPDPCEFGDRCSYYDESNLCYDKRYRPACEHYQRFLEDEIVRWLDDER